MKSATSKLLHPICGRTLVGHVLAASQALDPEHLVVVVGHAREAVSAHVAEVAPEAITAHQTEQLGTGNAVRRALEALPEEPGTVVVLNGDAPLLTTGTLRELIAEHTGANNAATVLSATVPDPTGLGRIVRDADGALERIVEQRDATPAERAIHEINSGMFAFDGPLLRAALKRLTTDNAQGQEYLTDVVALLRGDGHPVAAVVAPDYRETLGCNDRVELALLRALLRDRLLDAWMREGVTVVDPATVWIDAGVTIGRDAVIYPNVQLQGSTVIGAGAQVGPDSTLTDTEVGEGAAVVRTHSQGARIAAGATVGPFAYLRPGTVLGEGGKIGTFVETKNADIGAASKVPHLTYVGDATIGEHSNIGASSVFVNYDGVRKQHSTIGSHVRTGSDNMFVAPVTIGDGAYTAAGSVITDDVPPGAMGVARARQRNVEGWVERRRAGTPAAEAAARARAAGSSGGSQTGDEPGGPVSGASAGEPPAGTEK
ncbi:MAG: bifunctional UDP-N-acetylglucosamine pyrophosphorylase / glucosamine-phosphate N-acetyltransferase [Cryptosporangiaceae bacterium]|nr:bifunctional UDP-N-acetylglucosamine pyrophosphorylase / glucosamine-phosphate N-acetyltransferase [Cryptosporangiaceae bacterium]